MAALINIILQVLGDVTRFVILQLRPTRSVRTENLFLRRQLAPFKERGINPRQVDAATRISLSFLGRLFDWRDALSVV
jgi:putative transposase